MQQQGDMFGRMCFRALTKNGDIIRTFIASHDQPVDVSAAVTESMQALLA